jgi:hypothetical protein
MSRLRFFAVALALGAAACGNDPVTTPTPTTPVTVTDTFSGTLTPNGATTRPFTTAASGTVTATLSSLAPDSTLIIGLALGIWNGNSCQVIFSKDTATQFSQVQGAVSSAGSLCVRVYDVGNLIDPATYEVQVNHP